MRNNWKVSLDNSLKRLKIPFQHLQLKPALF